MRKMEKLQDFGFNTRFTDGSIEFAGYSPYDLELDSHKTRIHIRIKAIDSLNVYLDNSMLKLSESLSKLNEQLLSEEFLRNIPEYDSEEFHVEVDVDEIREAIKESMKEFDENMEVLKYCTKISDAAYSNTITDLMAMNINNQNLNLLLSSSWDGTIIIWK